MTLENIVRMALEQNASDVHLEPKIPITLRVNGSLRRTSTALDKSHLREIAEHLLSDDEWSAFSSRGSHDLSQTIAGTPCRINLLRTDRGIGLAIRLLSTLTTSIARCNLHPSLTDFIDRDSGLILLTGPTGSGKSTTLSALLEEINQRHARHIITLEAPIEYRIAPKKSIVRQREVGLHTPSFEQGLMDSLREDPDVLVVGEMREAESMRLTLNAAETGHLVFATMHSSNAAEAIYRMMMSFPPERQNSVLAQLAETLIAVVSHKMTYRPEQKLNVPACEILVANHAVRHVIRKGEVSKMPSLLQTGGTDGMWTFERYQNWLDGKTEWVHPEPPTPATEPLEEENAPRIRDEQILEREPALEVPSPSPRRSASSTYAPRTPAPRSQSAREPITRKLESLESTNTKSNESKAPGRVRVHKDGRIEIPEPNTDLEDILRELKDFSEE